MAKWSERSTEEQREINDAYFQVTSGKGEGARMDQEQLWNHLNEVHDVDFVLLAQAMPAVTLESVHRLLHED